VLTVTKGISQVQAHYRGSDREFLRVLLNSRSAAEANLALGLLRDAMPEKALVTAINLREILRDLPACPFAMAVDIDTIARVANLTRDRGAYERSFADAGGDFDLVVIGEGNLCYDLIVRSGERNIFWTPHPHVDDIVHPLMLDPIMRHETLLRRVIELVKDMGMVYSPTFYLSLEDWLLEYAEDTMDDLRRIF
jgi:hypothetical protein